MTEKEWSDLLQTYTTSFQVAQESLVGITEHIDMPCNRGRPQVVVVPGLSMRGSLDTDETCDRGTRGCNLTHNDKIALHFARLALERIQDIESGDAPFLDVEPVTIP